MKPQQAWLTKRSPWIVTLSAEKAAGDAATTAVSVAASAKATPSRRFTSFIQIVDLELRDDRCALLAYTEQMARRSDDATLIRLVRRGDRDAMARLCETYWSVAWKGAYAVLLDRTLSDDATQEAMLRVLRALDTFDETRPLAPWIRPIAVNQALDQRGTASRP